MYYCSRYMKDIETSFNRPPRVDDHPESSISRENALIPLCGKEVGGSTTFILSELEKLQAHRHILVNCSKVDPFLKYDYYISHFTCYLV